MIDFQLQSYNKWVAASINHYLIGVDGLYYFPFYSNVVLFGRNMMAITIIGVDCATQDKNVGIAQGYFESGKTRIEEVTFQLGG